ncbi:MAG: carboxylating nicotinate-nucleotide diphosphorylase [Chloroflexota bacterium]|nr:carboxylating nicotinate-nucleotide diphosphorylase [Chloroflexota bacterium]MDE2940864.1 carboxylating nicotinate-nucleotide diphosphorylase [Chloroflexota bacterium]MDE3267546.1 carboxylating nicotinate-nucleotide diphosphorylase [Chloroflexota bacterium]
MQITSSIRDIVERALVEDLGHGDVTTDALIPTDARGQAVVVVKADGVVAGLEVALEVFRQVDASTRGAIHVPDGTAVSPGDVVADVEGSVAGILKAERVALNFLQRLSGIATATAAYVRAVQDTKARIIDTRKTVPGLRQLEKYAVRAGGGHNHRYNLADGILIKDNHIAALRARELGLEEIVDLARQRSPHTLRIEIEVETVEEAVEALDAGADAVLLDNMSPEEMRRVVEISGGRALLEASGGVTLDTVRAVAETGVDLISVGALTHSVRALDISLDLG